MVRLLIAASGTGGHLFPALALAEKLSDYHIEWLGVPNRLEQTLIGDRYPLHSVPVEGLQTRSPIQAMKVLAGLGASVWQVKQLLQQEQFDLVLTTGGYIAGPAIVAARLQKIPAILHESNYLPGKVTRWFSRWCEAVAIGFAGTAQYLPDIPTVWVSTPVRSQFYTPQPLALPIAEGVPLIVVVGGSQGAVAINRLVRECAAVWLEAGVYIVHLTGENDPEASSLQHPHYISLPFYDNMAGLLQRASLAISRSGAGTLTELAITSTPSILIPYPFAAEDHQAYNAKVFAEAGAAYLYRQEELTAGQLQQQVLALLNSPSTLQQMAAHTATLAVADSAERLAALVRKVIDNRKHHRND